MRTASLLFLIGCTGAKETDTSATAFASAVVGTAADGLSTPRDLALSPGADGQLWVVNMADSSVTIFDAVGTSAQSSQHLVDPAAHHFMDQVSSLAFGSATHSGSPLPTFATCQESRNEDGDRNFMGPTLWSSDLDIFAQSNPDAIAYHKKTRGYYEDLGSHLDMLHESPLCMGVAWEDENVYWVFDGGHSASTEADIVRYDFQEDHGPGYDDHSDGTIWRYAQNALRYVEGVPSHLAFDPASRLLYIADTGNSRVAILDTTSGKAYKDLPSEDDCEHVRYTGADLSVLVDGLAQPSGLALDGDSIWVTEHASGVLYQFDLAGVLLREIDTGRGAGALMGIEADGSGRLWLVDALRDEVFWLEPG